MKKLKIPVFLLLVALIFASFWVSAAETVVAPNYFPLAVGDEWTYLRTSQVINEKLFVNVTGKMQPTGSTLVFYQLNNYNGQAHWVQQTNTGMVYEYPNYEWYFLNAEVGKPWTMHINTKIPGVIIGSDGAILTVVSRNEVVKVPAGIFTTVHIRFQTRVMDAGITDEWFAPGVGLVKRMESSFVGAINTELVRAVIDGVVIENPLVTTSVTTDKPVYWEDHMPTIVPPTTGPEIIISCTVTPSSGQPTVLNFIDYNVWDVSIINPDGRVVWTNPKIAAPAPAGGVNRTIPGSGETTRFSARLAYGSMVGKYKVVAKLLVSQNPPADAVTYFEYRWVY
ncbi:MAG TPA: hypothetical protein VHY08_02700 [Bacillota bacterium]|nr:hypothetical protein [Bacillota bacterium]